MTTKKLRPLLALPILAVLLTSCIGLEYAYAIQRVNEEREARGVHPVLNHPTLQAKAQAWSEALAAQGSLAHSNLADGAGGGWRALGENLAMASTIDQAHGLLMNSGAHRSTMLSGRYTHIGVGVASANGNYYVVQVFGG
ncbi:MAG: CAP domain-containing protein [Actinomycetia bacterium]|nr:CAP domain-containing protein [Actinomycetes bacterium]